MPSVVLAEDHALVRDGIRRILEAQGSVVVAEVGDGPRVLEVVEETRPDVLLLDLGLPGLHGLDVLREVSRRVPGTKTLVLSGDGRPEFVVGALRHGAAGYLLKSGPPAELVAAVAAVADGRRFLSPEVAAVLAGAMGGNAPTRGEDPYETLTRREREVFHLMAEGLSNTDVGARLFISRRTVETHRANIVTKLGLRTQTDVVLFALRRGLLTLDR